MTTDAKKRAWIAEKIQMSLDNPDYHGGTLYPVNLTPAGWREVLSALAPETSPPAEQENREVIYDWDIAVRELCHQLGLKDGEHMLDALWDAVRDAKRYRRAREIPAWYDGMGKKCWGEELDRVIDAAGQQRPRSIRG